MKNKMIKVIATVFASSLPFHTNALDFSYPWDSDGYKKFIEKATPQNMAVDLIKLCGTVLQLAKRDDKVAQFIIASDHYNVVCENKCYGCSQSPNIREDLSWLRKSAANGYAVAQHELGSLYEKGDVVPQDINEAEKWYMKAAMQGNAYAQDQLAGIYWCEYGHLCSDDKRNVDKALFWYKKACENGYSIACTSYKNNKSQADYWKEGEEMWQKSLKKLRRNCIKNHEVVPCDSL